VEMRLCARGGCSLFFFFLQVTHRGLGALDGSRYGGVYKEL